MTKKTKCEPQASFPEHDKLRLAKPTADIIADFLEFQFHDKRRMLCHYVDNHDYPVQIDIGSNIEKLLAEYLEIDLEAIEQEKQMMLAMCRKSSDKSNSTTVRCGSFKEL